MNDPHIVAIRYELVFGKDVVYQAPSGEIVYVLPDFDVEVTGTDITLKPNAHFSSKELARAASDPIMRAWEVKLAMEVATLDVTIKYKNTEVIDRNPTPGVIELQAEAIAMATAFAHASVRRTFNRFLPAPEAGFVFTSDVKSLWQRYRAFKEGKEPLLSMTYFSLTLVVSMAENLKQAARALNIDEAILRKLGELSSNRGDQLSARKISARVQPLTALEEMWIEHAVRAMILQAGRSSNEPSNIRLCMADLPSLSP